MRHEHFQLSPRAKLSRFAGVRARRRDPERSAGPQTGCEPSASRGTPSLLRALQIAAVFVAATFLLGADPSGARFENLGHKLMCRCGCNQILLECNHVGCSYSEKMRQELMAGLQGPDSDDLVLQRFVQEYGGVVLAAPPATGFNRVAWITPFAALGAGIFAVVWVVRRWRLRQVRLAAGSPSAPPANVELDPFRERARKETEL